MEVKIVKIVRPANDVTRRTCIWRDPANGHSFIFSFITPIADVEIFSSKFGFYARTMRIKNQIKTTRSNQKHFILAYII